LGDANVESITAQTLTEDLTLAGNVVASGTGTPITLVAKRNFLNADNKNLSAANGRWLIYSTCPVADVRGSLLTEAYNFKMYGTSYGDPLPVAATGHGVIYSALPNNTFTYQLTGSLTKVYDANLGTAGANGTVSLSTNAQGWDGDLLSMTPGILSDVTFLNKNVGTQKTLTGTATATATAVTNTNSAGVLRAVYGPDSATQVAGYTKEFSGAVSGNVGAITPRAAAINGTTTNVTYNGQTQSQNSATTSGFIAGDDVGVAAGGLANGRNAGIYGSNLAVMGSDASNYSVTINNANLVITGSPAAPPPAVGPIVSPLVKPISNIVIPGFGLASAAAGVSGGGVGTGPLVEQCSEASPENCDCKETELLGVEICRGFGRVVSYKN
jgi:hypothetical protein